VDSIVSLCLGLGLAAACGLRVFVPLLVMAVGSKLGLVHLTPEFSLLGSWGAIAALALICAAELLAYSVPWVDHALDVIATPAAIIAGGIATAAQMGIIAPVQVTDVSQLAQASHASWVQPAIGLGSAVAGGGLAGLVQTSTVAARTASTWTTAGVLNPIVSAVESAAAVVLSVLAILVPAFLAIVLALVLLLVVRGALRRRAARLA
jgi:hypothetical protein